VVGSGNGEGLAVPKDLPLLVTIGEASRLLTCSRSMVKVMIARGEIAVVKLGRLTRIPRSALEEIADVSRSAGRAGSFADTYTALSEQLEYGLRFPPHRRVGALTRKRRGNA
jgi:excisionase family DNA binding protein